MIQLATIDYVIMTVFFLTTIGIGLYVAKQSGKSASEYFLSGKKIPWWLLGVSMVATTFSTDTPNLVTDIVRKNGVSGNWVWWAFLLTGLLTVFVYARLWRKSNVNTDMEFYELRYGGAPARFLRGFRAVYLGLIFNIMAMAAVSLAAIKIGEVMLGLPAIETLVIGGSITLVFSFFGGFKGVVYTDFILFFVAMAGAVGAAYYLVNLPEVGGIEAMLSNPLVASKMSILPDITNTEAVMTLLIIPLAVQWWSAWYPGAEPGGGGYIAQRMLASKNENHAMGATFFFNIMHYAIRPWPWILVALASLVIYPDILSIQEAFPSVTEDKLGHDLAYSAMLTKLPVGLMGLVLTSLIAAYMSTISTHLNWGASYMVYDVYKKSIQPDATEKEMVWVGKLTTIGLLVLSGFIALALTNATQIFEIILMFGAGTGLLFILRWFWWRINAWSEISAMVSSGIISLLFTFTWIGEFLFGGEEVLGVFAGYWKFPFVVGITTIVWILVTFLTRPEKKEVLVRFYQLTEPGGPGWKTIIDHSEALQMGVSKAKGWMVPKGILAMLVASVFIYSILFATGYWIYGQYTTGIVCSSIALLAGGILYRQWDSLKETIFEK